MEEGQESTHVEPRNRLDNLPIPQEEDSITALERKLVALAEAVHSGKSVALVTSYAACAIQERDTTKKAVAEMSSWESDVWSLYVQGTYPLPKIDWKTSRGRVPVSPRPLRLARRRAEALNRLYKTTEADESHAVWLVNNELDHLPLVKAMARVIGAERDLLGGQSALNAIQMADLQSINHILSVSGQVLAV